MNADHQTHMVPTRARQARDLRVLSEAAMVVGLSVTLGNMRLLELPQGGSISLAALPILLFALTRGFRAAFLAGWCAGVGHALAGGTIIHPAQLLLDYGLAYASLALASLGQGGGTLRRRLGVVVAAAAHLACMTVSGAVFFATALGSHAWTFSLAYNAATVVPETVIALWALPIVVAAWARADPIEAWRCGLAAPPQRHAVVALPSGPRLPDFAPRVADRVHISPRRPRTEATKRHHTGAFTSTLASRAAPFARTPFGAGKAAVHAPESRER